MHPFIPYVKRCTKCQLQLLGHSKRECRRKTGRCTKCGKGHTGDHCPSFTLCCLNCNGDHSAAWKGCPEVQIRHKANEIKAARYVPYGRATSKAIRAVATTEVEQTASTYVNAARVFGGPTKAIAYIINFCWIQKRYCSYSHNTQIIYFKHIC